MKIFHFIISIFLILICSSVSQGQIIEPLNDSLLHPIQELIDKDPGIKIIYDDDRKININQDFSKEDSVFTIVGTQPGFPGGQKLMYKFISDSLIYPVEAKVSNSQGKVFMQFIVEKDGTISSITVYKDRVGHGAVEEAYRILKKMPLWKPGIKNGKTVRVLYTLPFEFKL